MDHKAAMESLPCSAFNSPIPQNPLKPRNPKAPNSHLCKPPYCLNLPAKLLVQHHLSPNANNVESGFTVRVTVAGFKFSEGFWCVSKYKCKHKYNGGI